MTITGLSTGVAYQAMLQANTTSASTTQTLWENSGGHGLLHNWPIYFTTYTQMPSPPVVNLTENQTEDYSPGTVHLTYSTISGTTQVPDLNSLTWNYGDGVVETFYTASNRGYSYDWFHPVHSYPVVSVYTIVATGANVAGTASGSIAFTVTSATITATFTYTTSTGEDRQINVYMTDSSTVNNTAENFIQSRLWAVTGPGTTGASVTNDAGSWVHTFGTTTTDGGKYSITLTATSVIGQTASTSVSTAFWVPYLPAVASFTGAPKSIRVGETVTFYNSSTGDGLTASWNFGDSGTSTSTAASVTHSYSVSSNYTVGLVVTASSTLTTVNSSSLSYTNYIYVAPTTFSSLLGGALQELQWHLLGDPDANPCNSFTEFGGAAQILVTYYRRLHDFLKRTEITKTEATLSSDTAGVYPLPADLLELCRVEVDGYAVQSMDAKQADLYESAWESDTTTPYGYIHDPEESLTIKLVPDLTGRTVKVIYIAAPSTPSAPGDCLTWGVLPLPYSISWGLKWGVLADLLSQEGEMNDPVRAQFAEELYEMSVELTKQMFQPAGEKS